MNEFELEIFQQTSDYCELRLSGGTEPRTRGLNRRAVNELIEVVDRAYAEDSVAQRVFGSAQLRELGERLYAFLDGDERWLGWSLRPIRAARGCDSRPRSGCVICRGSCWPGTGRTCR